MTPAPVDAPERAPRHRVGLASRESESGVFSAISSELAKWLAAFREPSLSATRRSGPSHAQGSGSRFK